MDKTFGTFFKEKRIALGVTLRAFCTKFGFDAGNISKLERGMFPPPESDAKLEEYATALGLKPGSTEWLEFFDRAAAECGRIPTDILSDEAVVAKLPVLFRTIRGAKVDDAHLDKLVERIRKA